MSGCPRLWLVGGAKISPPPLRTKDSHQGPLGNPIHQWAGPEAEGIPIRNADCWLVHVCTGFMHPKHTQRFCQLWLSLQQESTIWKNCPLFLVSSILEVPKHKKNLNKIFLNWFCTPKVLHLSKISRIRSLFSTGCPPGELCLCKNSK